MYVMVREVLFLVFVNEFGRFEVVYIILYILLFIKVESILF